MRLSVLLLLAGVAAAFDNTVYLIRHGEKPNNGGNGLSPRGARRAEVCLPNVFGNSSAFDIGKIMAQRPKANGKRRRPLETVLPVAGALGLTVDSSCDRDDPACVTAAIAAFARASTADVLICWEHKMLTDIMEALGVAHAPHYPKHTYDLIYAVRRGRLVATTSEHCPGLDDRAGLRIMDSGAYGYAV